jgi:hypothetical protein
MAMGPKLNLSSRCKKDWWNIYMCVHVTKASKLSLTTPTFRMPTVDIIQDDKEDSKFEQHKTWKVEMKTNNEVSLHTDGNNKKLYGLVWGQCTEPLHNKVKACHGIGRKNKSGGTVDI